MRFAPDTSWLLAWRSPIPSVLSGALPLAGPSAPQVFVSSGEDPGEIFISVFGAPTSAGDGAAAGDMLGVITDYQLQIAGGAWTSYGTTLPIEETFGGFTPGAPVAWSARALGYNNRPGQVVSGIVNAAIDEPVEPIALTDSVSGEALTDSVSGEALTVSAAA